MSRRVTTISLDEKTAAIAKTLPNFSHFVRECLIRYSLGATKDNECHWQKPNMFNGRCNPLVVNRAHCFVCWPNGRPEKANVKLFLNGGFTLEELDRMTYLENKHLIDLKGPSLQEKKTSKRKKGGGVFSWIRGR